MHCPKCRSTIYMSDGRCFGCTGWIVEMFSKNKEYFRKITKIDCAVNKKYFDENEFETAWQEICEVAKEYNKIKGSCNSGNT